MPGFSFSPPEAAREGVGRGGVRASSPPNARWLELERLQERKGSRRRRRRGSEERREGC